MSKIALGADAFVTKQTTFTVPNGKEKLSLIAKDIGFIQVESIKGRVRNDPSFNALAEIARLSVADENGNQFTYEEVTRLKKEVAAPLFDAVIEVNGLGEEEEAAKKK